MIFIRRFPYLKPLRAIPELFFLSGHAPPVGGDSDRVIDPSLATGLHTFRVIARPDRNERNRLTTTKTLLAGGTLLALGQGMAFLQNDLLVLFRSHGISVSACWPSGCTSSTLPWAESSSYGDEAPWK